MSTLNIVVDENMPFAEELFSRLGSVRRMPGRQIRAEDLRDVDALMVRSITRVDEQLLAGNDRLKFVGTATIGMDHLDEAALKSRGIQFTNAPGCNAISVGEYVVSALLATAQQQAFDLRSKRIAVIGAGNTGTQTANKLAALGCQVELCDPPLQAKGDPRSFISYQQALQADIISFHVPYWRGEQSTFHLLDQTLIEQLKPGTILLNCGRGEVMDNQALLTRMQQRNDMTLIMDVWENEPQPLRELLPHVAIATPHIAGYSLEGKARGTSMIYESYCRFLGQPEQVSLSDLLPKPMFDHMSLASELDQPALTSLVHLVYDVRRDDGLMRLRLDEPSGFDALRKQYHDRREFSSLTLASSDPDTVESMEKLGFKIKRGDSNESVV